MRVRVRVRVREQLGCILLLPQRLCADAKQDASGNSAAKMTLVLRFP